MQFGAYIATIVCVTAAYVQAETVADATITSSSVFLSSASQTAANNAGTTGLSMNQSHPLGREQVCTDSNWSGSSAWWLLTALAVGCMAHPRGSVAFPLSQRLWRISPLFLLVEDFVFVIRIYQAFSPLDRSKIAFWLQQPPWSSLRIVSHTLLATREKHVWDQKDYDDFFSDLENAHYVSADARPSEILSSDPDSGPPAAGVASGNDARNGSIPMRTWSHSSDHNNNTEPPALPSVLRISTLELEEGSGGLHDTQSRNVASSNISRPELSHTDITASSILNDTPTATLDEWFTIGYDVSAQTTQKISILMDACFSKHLDQVEEYEKGPIYRFLLWFPMLQGLIKICFISGAPWTKTIAVIYLASFMLVEGLHLFARDPLTKTKRVSAMALGRRWNHMMRRPRSESNLKKKRNRIVGIRLQSELEELLVLCYAPALILNLALTHLTIQRLHWWTHYTTPMWIGLDVGFDSSQTSSAQLIVFIIIVFTNLIALVGFIVLSCAWVFLLFMMLFAPLYLAMMISAIMGRGEFEEDQVIRLMIDFIAIQSAIFALLIYAELGQSGGLRFDCQSTWVWRGYNWLG